MNEKNYIEEIEYWLIELKEEIKYAKFSIKDHDITLIKNTINNRCNNILLNARALKEKLENE